jgi:hypothetical protein
MMTVRQVAVAFAMGVLTLIAVFVSHAALVNIHRGAGDLAMEWRTLRFCFALVVAFQFFILATLLRVIRRGRASGE